MESKQCKKPLSEIVNSVSDVTHFTLNTDRLIPSNAEGVPYTINSAFTTPYDELIRFLNTVNYSKDVKNRMKVLGREIIEHVEGER